MKKNFFLHYLLVFLIALFLTGCAGSNGLQYSPVSDNANSGIITEARTLIDKATESYSLHAAEVDTLKAHIEKIVATESMRKRNEATNAMWAAVQKDKQNLYDFFELWKQQDKISAAAVPEIKSKLLSVLIIIQSWEQRKKDGPLFNK